MKRREGFINGLFSVNYSCCYGAVVCYLNRYDKIDFIRIHRCEAESDEEFQDNIYQALTDAKKEIDILIESIQKEKNFINEVIKKSAKPNEENSLE